MEAREMLCVLSDCLQKRAPYLLQRETARNTCSHRSPLPAPCKVGQYHFALPWARSQTAAPWRWQRNRKGEGEVVAGGNLPWGVSDLQRIQVLFNPSGLHIPQPLGIEEP